jgi:hypothetical protein
LQGFFAFGEGAETSRNGSGKNRERMGFTEPIAQAGSPDRPNEHRRVLPYGVELMIR